MQRLAISFSLVFLLVVSLLAYFLRQAYLEEREVLTGRIEADIQESRSSIIMEQFRGLKGLAATTDRDTLIEWKREDVPAPKWDTDPGFPIVTSVDTAITISVGRFGRPGDPEYEAGTLRIRTHVNNEDLDTLSLRYGVTLVHFASREDADRAGAWPISETSRRNAFFDASQRAIGMLDYRWTLLGGLGYEAAFALLLLAAIGFAFYTAFVSLEEQQRQLRERESLIANVAHELKTPIATVGVALEAMDSFGADLEPTRRREYLELSRNELGRLDRMADRAIASLEYEGLRERLTLGPVDLVDLTRQAWRGLALRHGLAESTLTISEDQQSQVRGDAHYLFHAIYNLLDNAVKYGGQPPEITIRLRSGPGQSTSYTVHDNGLGIPPELASRMFERFFRGGNDGHRVKGHGLGLSFVRQIVEAHAGSVVAGTDPSGGGYVGFNLARP
jgi:signal transduction histidine kinase